MKEIVGSISGEYDCDKGYAVPDSIILPSHSNAHWLKKGDVLTFNGVPYVITSKKIDGASVSFKLREKTD